MKKKFRICMMIICVAVIGINIFLISKNYANTKFEVYTRNAKSIISLEKDEILQQKIDENTFPIEYHFMIDNYTENEINEIEFDYAIKIECSVDNFPICYQLIDEEAQEEIVLANGKSKKFKIAKDVKQRKKLKLVLKWRELNGNLADFLQINLKIEVDEENGEKIEEKIITLTRDDSEPICKVSYSTAEMTNENVVVTLTCNKEVEQASGFELSEDRKTLSKEVSENKSEMVTVRDLSGNSTVIEYHVNNIDKEAPIIMGCKSGGIYKSPLELEYYDNHEIKEVEIDKYSEHLVIVAYQIEKETSELMVSVEEHPLNTKKYRYYVNNKLYSTVTESSYVFTSLDKTMENEIKVEALDELGNVLDTAVVQDIQSGERPESVSFSKEQLSQKGNYQIKVRDFAGNEAIYDIKIK